MFAGPPTATNPDGPRIIDDCPPCEPGVLSRLPNLWTTAGRIGTAAGTFVYPPTCAHCAKGLEQWSAGRLCETCRGTLACNIARACLRCGAPVGPGVSSEAGCQHCRKDRFAFDRVWALGVYEGELQRACVRAKEPFAAPLAAGLADLLVDAWEPQLRFEEIDLIVPVPHHWTHRLTRQHLTPETIGGVLSHRLKVAFSAHILGKVRRTPARIVLAASAASAEPPTGFSFMSRGPADRGARAARG